MEKSAITPKSALEGYDFSGSKYGNQDRYQAVVAYLVNGTLTGASKICGVPVTTLHGWTKADWWQGLLEQVRTEKEEEFRAGFTRIVDKAIARTEEALDKGEVKLVKTKDGYEERRVPVGAKDATMIGAITYDKLRLSENKPTAISQTESTKSIQAQLEALSKKLDEQERREKAKIVAEQNPKGRFPPKSRH